MRETNWAEVQKRHDDGTLSVEEAYRCGQTHAAYGWTCTPNGGWDAERQAAYRKGHAEYKAKHPRSHLG